MDIAVFLTLTDAEVAAIVRNNGPRVVVFPINGTRRWYLLENGENEPPSNGAGGAGFLDRILDRYIELFELIFGHGISALLTPILGPDIAAREPAYQRLIHAALHEITGGERFAEFYDRLGLRVRFYGDYQPYLDAHAPEITERIERLQAATAGRSGGRLLWGMFAHDSVETIGRLAIEHHAQTGRPPQRADLVSAYYGEPIPPADIFIGMLPPRVFDFPLLDTGDTALYFTTAPSPYLDRGTLRRILFDFLYHRPTEEDYELDGPQAFETLRSYYREHRKDLTGTGRLVAGGRVWVPD